MVFITVRQGSVTHPDADVDVLVNASNTLGQLGSGVSAAIRKDCGPGFQAVIDDALAARGGSTLPGDVWLTHAGKHPRARFVAHVAVMDDRDVDVGGAAVVRGPDAARIARGCRALWQALDALAYERPLHVGMVALGAGTGALGVRLPTTTAITTLHEHVRATPSTSIAAVTFFGFDLIEYLNTIAALVPHTRLPPAVVDDVDVQRFLRDVNEAG